MEIDKEIWTMLAKASWEVRSNAYLIGKTQVGCALLSEENNIYVGCNIEHIFRSHDIHAEVNAISNMVAAGEKKFKAIIITAERHRFTPCGACMDWIMQHGGEHCYVAYQNTPDSQLHIYKSKDLMPFYPI